MGHATKSLLVRDLMTPVVMALEVGDTLDQAKIEMKFGHVRHLPVIDEQARVVGLVSQRDLLAALGTAGGVGDVRVGPIMKTDVRVVTADTPIQEVIALMVEHRYGALPVVDAAGGLIGIITEMDFLLYVYREVTGASFEPSWYRTRPEI